MKTETITQDEMLYLTIGNYGGFVQLDQDEDTILLQKSRIPELIRILNCKKYHPLLFNKHICISKQFDVNILKKVIV